MCAAGPALLSVTFQGALSDSFGRKPAMFVSVIGTTAVIGSCLLLVFVSFDVQFLFIGQAVYGFCGTYAALLMAVLAAAADTTPADRRTERIGFLEGAIITGLCAGSLSGGLVVERFGRVALYGLCLAVLCMCGLFVLVMPETLPVERRRKFEPLKSNAFSVLRILVSSKAMVVLSCVFVLNVGVIIGASNALQLYTDAEFHMSLEIYGYLQASLQFFRAVGLLVILPLLLRHYHHAIGPQCLIGVASALVGALQVILWAILNQQWWLMFIVNALGLGTAWTVIVTRGMMSRLIPADQQGTLMGAIAVMEACLIPFGMVAMFNSTFSATKSFMPGFFFFVGAGCFGASAFMIFVARHFLYQREGELRPLLSGEKQTSVSS